MESLNLNTLATSLPTAQQKAEQELLNNFKAAALSITTLYRSSRQSAKRAYNAGYAAACQDLLTMIQQGVSVGGLGTSMPSSSSDASDVDDGMTIGRVMDWTEARLEAIKAQEEDEDEEEEREREKERTRSTSCAPQGHNKPAPATSHPSPPPALPTPSSPAFHSSNHPPEPTTPSPTLHQSNVPRATQRSKLRTAPSKGELLSSHTNVPTIPTTSVFSFMPEMVTPISPPISFPEMSNLPAVGTKRRHAMMMMLDATTPTTAGSNNIAQPPAVVNTPVSPASFSGPVRRRTRSNRGFQQNQNINNVMQPSNESMDIEDDGRERKRVARR